MWRGRERTPPEEIRSFSGVGTVIFNISEG